MKMFIKIACLSIFLYSCTTDASLNFIISHDNRLFNEFTGRYDENALLEDRILWVMSGAKLFTAEPMFSQLISLYFSKAHTTEDILFRDFIYFTLSELYWKEKNTEMFVYCAGLISDESLQILNDGVSIHYTTGLKIIKLEGYDDFRINAYKKLLTHFKNDIDEVLLNYELSVLYKKNYKIDDAILAMKNTLSLIKDSKLSDYPFNHEELSNEIQFYSMKKKWISQDLSDLISRIKYALNTHDMSKVNLYTSRIGFFVKFFNSNDDKIIASEAVLNRRWIGRAIIFADKFEELSNENEVFLETRGWLLPQMNTWYLYFKRVHYPYDDEIDGGWEWKGIYFGNWL